MEDQNNIKTPFNGEDDIVEKSDLNDVLTNEVKPLSIFENTFNNFNESCKKIGLWIVDFVFSIFLSLWHFITLIGKGFRQLTVGTYLFFEKKVRQFKYNDWSGRLSFIAFGASSFKHKQYVNGVLYVLFEIGYILFLVFGGAYNMYMLGTLGTAMPGPDPNCDDMFCEWVEGDNSILILIYGLLSVLSIILFVYIWNRSINSGYDNYRIDNFMKYKNLLEDNKEFSNKIDEKAKEYVYNNLKISNYVKDNRDELSTYIANLEQKLDEKDQKFYIHNAKFMYRKGIIHSFSEHKEILKLETKLKTAETKLANIKDEFASAKELFSEKYETKDGIVNDEKALTFETHWKARINRQVSVINKIKNRLQETKLRHSSFVQREDVLNSTKYERFNDYYKVVANYENEIKFFKNYETILSKFNSLEGKFAEVNERNTKTKADLLVSLEQKQADINKKYDEILAKKKDINAQLKELNIKKAEELKNAEDSYDADKIEDKYFVDIQKLSSRLHALPEDKNIAAMRKEELKEVKHAISRDRKYLKTNFTEQTYRKEEIVNFLLLEYKFDYKFANKIVLSLFVKNADGQVGPMTTTEVDNKLDELNINLAEYKDKHQDKYVGRAKSFKEQVKALKNENFHLTILSLPVIGILLFTILPLLFSILVAFTNYSFGHIPPTQLFTWVGLENFFMLFNAPADSIYADLPGTVAKTLSWTIVWTIIATFSNYFLGILLALIINKKSIKLKKLWRTVFVMTIAIPQFISLMTIGILLKDSGAIGSWWNQTFGFRLGFGTSVDNGAAVSKLIILLVNIWIGIPYTMLSTTGILLNIPTDLYESATVDGAGPRAQFTKITLPYILFVTGPYLITQFVGNINNFNVIYFLTGGGPNISGTSLQVGYTDLLVTFLYKMITSNNNPQFGIASTVGILIFVICAFFSIIMYNKSGAVQSEDQFQ